MDNAKLIEWITKLAPNSVFDEKGEFLNVNVPKENFREVMQALRNSPETAMDFLFCLTCVDWTTNLTMVYHLTSTTLKHTLVLKVALDNRENPEIETVCDIWKTAEFHEREVFDLFGVKFINHPDLRRIFLDDDWVGFPLRKDYVDEINIVSL